MESEPEGGFVSTSRMRLGFVLAGVIIILSMAGATVGVGMVQINHVATTLRDFGHTEPFRQGTITAPPAGKPQTLLLVGSDRRYGDARGDARSDTLMLIRLNPKKNATNRWYMKSPLVGCIASLGTVSSMTQLTTMVRCGTPASPRCTARSPSPWS